MSTKVANNMEQDNPIDYKPKETAQQNNIIETVKKYLAAEGFQHKIIGDTPTDNNQLVPRKFVTANGATTARPVSPVIGQFYYDTTIGKPIWWNGTLWKDAQNNTV